MNKFTAASLSLLFLIGSAVLSVAHAQEEEHHHSCACEAEELGFKIDCSDTATMLTAMAALQASSCATTCTSSDCIKNFFIVQSHHDHCPEGGVPKEIEDGFHDFDEVCEACEISKLPTEGAPDCPTPVCDDGSGNTAFAALIDAGCLTNCTSETCHDNFFLLRSVHDTCPHDSLSEAAEEGLHDLEEACAEQICNPPVTHDPLVCVPEEPSSDGSTGGTDGSTSANGSSDATSIASMAASSLAVVSMGFFAQACLM